MARAPTFRERTKPVPLVFEDTERTFADIPPLLVKNRFLERSVSSAGQQNFVARPGSSVFTSLGAGPIRATYDLPGLFNGAQFVVSGTTLYRIETDGTVIPITGTVYGSGYVYMAGYQDPSNNRLFVSDGSHLQVYQGGNHATGTLTGTVNVSEGDTVQIGSSYFKWSATIVNGSGTAASPWVILLGADLATSLASLVTCISFTGTAGVDYSANLAGQNGEVTAVSDATTVTVTAISDLADGNLIATTVPVGTAVTWGGATLTGGGVHGLSGVAMPNGEPPGSLAVLKSYVIICVVGQGKFYFLQPGSIVINALDFATTETKPDATFNVLAVGDTLWFVGEDSTEVWYPTTSATEPFKPVSGRSFERGAIDGTVVNVKGEVFLVGPDFTVYAISGSPRRVSDNGVEELIRKTIVG